MEKGTKQTTIYKLDAEEKRALLVIRNLFRDMDDLADFFVIGDGRTVAEVFEETFGDFDAINGVIDLLDAFRECDGFEEQ